MVDPIHAFATLATALSYIKRPRTYSNAPSPSYPTKKKELRRILDTIATICPRSVEIVAVAAKTEVCHSIFSNDEWADSFTEWGLYSFHHLQSPT